MNLVTGNYTFVFKKKSMQELLIHATPYNSMAFSNWIVVIP